MAITAGERVFVDTNVLVYAAVSQAPFHSEARQAIGDHRNAGADLWISRQILREYLATLSRPQTFAIPQPMDVLANDIRVLEDSFAIAEDGAGVMVILLDVLGRVAVGGKQVHDANIVATMLAHNIQRLLTNNVGDYKRFSDWITVLPIVPSSA